MLSYIAACWSCKCMLLVDESMSLSGLHSYVEIVMSGS